MIIENNIFELNYGIWSCNYWITNNKLFIHSVQMLNWMHLLGTCLPMYEFEWPKWNHSEMETNIERITVKLEWSKCEIGCSVSKFMGGGTFGLHNGLGEQSIVHTQWVAPRPLPPNSIVNLNVPPPMSKFEWPPTNWMTIFRCHRKFDEIECCKWEIACQNYEIRRENLYYFLCQLVLHGMFLHEINPGIFRFAFLNIVKIIILSLTI